MIKINLDIREHVGFKVTGVKERPIDVKEGLALGANISKNSIMVDIEGIHVGPTRNFTWYTEECLKSSIKSWTYPYLKPLIMHHNEEDGKTIGRIVDAKYKDKNTKFGIPTIVFTVNVPDKEGIEQIKDGRLHTVSIGGRVEGVCSICNNPITSDEDEDFCGHYKGEVYENEVCYWKFTQMEGKELSYVVVPADKYAQNIRVYEPETKKAIVKEKYSSEREELNVSENLKKDTKEGKEVDEEITVENKSILETVKEEVSKVISQTEEKMSSIKKESEESISALKEEIQAIKEELESVKASVDKEVSLRKAAEDEASKAKKQAKEALVDQLVTLKAQSGKTVVAESLENRSFESIRDSIADAKEELNPINSISKPESVGLSIEESASKESKKKDEIDLGAEIQNLFSGLMSNNMR